MVLYASPILAAACYLATLITVTPTRAPAPIPAVGIIKSTLPPRDATGDLQVVTPPSHTTPSACGDIPRNPLADQPVLIEEDGRPGELMVMEEDEHGTYIMNSKDLRAIEHVARLTQMGIDCLKIEGRTKSHYYAARTAQEYQQAIDNAISQKTF